MSSIPKRQLTERFSRIVGYYRPVDGWNVGKRQEFEDRVTFKIPNISK